MQCAMRLRSLIARIISLAIPTSLESKNAKMAAARQFGVPGAMRPTVSIHSASARRTNQPKTRTDLATFASRPYLVRMRSRKRFAKDPTKPKLTHEERRASTFGDRRERTFHPSERDAAVIDVHFEFKKRAGLDSWMKRAVYLREFGRKCRRGKWRARAERGRDKRHYRRLEK